jgi:hypothetical protein
MNPMKKVMIFSALIMAPIVIALAIWLVPAGITAYKAQWFMSAFEKINYSKPPLTKTQVEQLMGRPIRIEQSESADQTVTGAVYHYPISPPGRDVRDFQVIFVNGVVFHTAIPSPTKS